MALTRGARGRALGKHARLSAVAALTAVAHLTALVPTAHAQQQYGASQTGPDAVVLKDGGVIRGTLSEMVPGDHATVLLSTGQIATIRWDVIQRVERGGVPQNATPTPAPAGTTPPPAAAAPPAPTGPQGNAYVHLDADSEVRLERQSGTTWVGQCNAPCDRELPLDGNYRIAGGSIRTSANFRLMATKPGDRVIISVNPASKGGLVGGIILAGIGTPFAIIGGLTLLVVAAIDAAPNHYVETGPAKIVGWSLFGIGAVGVIAGIVLITGNASTGVDQFNDTAKAAWLRAGAPDKRVPIWRDVTTPAPAQTGLSVPLLTGRF